MKFCWQLVIQNPSADIQYWLVSLFWSTGVSFLCYPLRRNFHQRKEYTYTTLHWHHSHVNTLCFTPEGTFVCLDPLCSCLHVSFVLHLPQELTCWAEASSRCLSSGSTARRASGTSCPAWEPPSRMWSSHRTERCSAPRTVTTVRERHWPSEALPLTHRHAYSHL